MSAKPGQRVGRLRAAPARKAGKVVDVWEFVTPIPGAGARTSTITVRVSLVSTDSGLAFQTFCEAFAPIQDSDINQLYERARTLLEAHSAATFGLVWEDWLKIKISAWDSEDPTRNARASLTLEVEPLKRGVDASTGQAYYLSGNGLWAHKMPEPKSIKRAPNDCGKPFGDPEWAPTEETEETAYVKATAETVAALADVRNRLRLLRERLAEALSQESIGNTLGDLASRLPLLAAPAGADKR